MLPKMLIVAAIAVASALPPSDLPPVSEASCEGVMCTMDMCPNGEPRHPIGDDCCACEGAAGDADVMPGEPTDDVEPFTPPPSSSPAHLPALQKWDAALKHVLSSVKQHLRNSNHNSGPKPQWQKLMEAGSLHLHCMQKCHKAHAARPAAAQNPAKCRDLCNNLVVRKGGVAMFAAAKVGKQADAAELQNPPAEQDSAKPAKGQLCTQFFAANRGQKCVTPDVKPQCDALEAAGCETIGVLDKCPVQFVCLDAEQKAGRVAFGVIGFLFNLLFILTVAMCCLSCLRTIRRRRAAALERANVPVVINAVVVPSDTDLEEGPVAGVPHVVVADPVVMAKVARRGTSGCC